jgi:hypothetical protein
MKAKLRQLLPLLLLAGLLPCRAQLWSPILNSTQAIDWSRSGVGPIPARPTLCARLGPSATLDQINAALVACPAGQTVFLAAGTYSIPGTIHIPSRVTLRGAGPALTILSATGRGDAVVSLGTGWVSYHPYGVLRGSQAGSTRVFLDHTSGIRTGMFLAFAEINNPTYVTSAGSEGTRNWTDGEWSKDGSLARGQIVEVTAVAGETVTFTPALYTAYTNAPVAVPFAASAEYAGVEDLQVYANNTGYSANFGLSACAYCWVRAVESNYADGDHVNIEWGFRDEVRDSYFSNAFRHEAGPHDSDIRLALKTSASLIENNIIDRTHQSILLQYGPAGNVIAYNYTTGEFDAAAVNYMVGGVFFHGAHPQFNLLEGNVITKLDADSTWGSSSQITAFRNWIVGTNRICAPVTGGRVPVTCSAAHYGYQAARAVQMSYLSTRNNFVANLVGSAQMRSLASSGRPLAQSPAIEYPSQRSYDDVAYGWSFGYGKESDDGSGTGCSGGTPPCHLAGTSATDFFHGNMSSVSSVITWAPIVPHQLPASFYLSGRPAWWGSLPFPATGPDVSGGAGPGGHSFGNPAQRCYLRVMGGSDGGPASPRPFDPAACYGE